MKNDLIKCLKDSKVLVEEHTTNLELIESHKKGKLKEQLEYFKILAEEYKTVNIPKDTELMEWYKQDREQSSMLISKYGESSWRIHRFMELCREEKISESFFRDLVRKEMDRCFEILNNGK